MYTSFVFSIGLLLAQALLIHANPLPELIRKFKQRSSDWFMSGSDCRPQQEYNISHQFAIEEPPALVAGVVCNATYSGCNLGDTLGYAVTVTTTLGFHLDIPLIAGLGLQGDVSISTTNAVAITVSESCPPGFTCGIQAIAHKWNVTGWQMTYYPGDGGNFDCQQRTTWDKYEVHFPMLEPGAQPNANAFVEYSICIINNSVNLYRRPVQIPLCPPLPDNAGPGVDYALKGPNNGTVVTASSSSTS